MSVYVLRDEENEAAGVLARLTCNEKTGDYRLEVAPGADPWDLPPILREAYTLFQIGEMSIHDIANQTGVSENLVKVRIFRAKEKLKTILADLHVTF